MIAPNRCPPGWVERSLQQRHSPRSAGTCSPLQKGRINKSSVDPGLSELAAEDCRLARAHWEPDADAGAPGEEVPQVLGKCPLHATEGDGSRLTAAGIPGSAETAADAHAEEGAIRQVHVLHFNNQRGVKAAVGDPCISSCPALGNDAADGGTREPCLGRGVTSLCH